MSMQKNLSNHKLIDITNWECEPFKKTKTQKDFSI